MKPKVVPTSPAGRSQAAAIEQLYTKNETLIQPVRMRVGWVFGSVMIIAALVVGFFGTVLFNWVVYQTPHWTLWQRLNINTAVTDQPPVVTTTSEPTDETWNNALLKAKPSIVTLYNARTGDALWDHVYTAGDGRGVGIVLSADGLLVTLDEYGVATDQAIVAVTADGTVMPVKSFFDDPASPFTFLTVAEKALNAAAFVSREQIVVTQLLGQYAPTVDSLAVDQVASVAATTAITQSTEGLTRTITLTNDAAVRSVVLTARGDVVGIATGGGAVIPLYHLSPVIKQALQEKIVERAFFGSQGISIATPGLTESERDGQRQGVLLTSSPDSSVPAVADGSPAAKAGLKAGDIITAVDDQSLATALELTEYIQSQGIGETITVKYVRDGKEKTVAVTLAKIP